MKFVVSIPLSASCVLAMWIVAAIAAVTDFAVAQDQSTTPAPATSSPPAAQPAAPPPATPAPAASPPAASPPTASQPAGTSSPAVAPAAGQPSHTGTPPIVVDGGAADTLLGKPVQSATGDDMGRIVDVMVDHTGMVRAAIIDFGGFLGVGTRKIAVDWRVLHFPKDGGMDKIVAELSQDQLRGAPAYKPGEPVVIVGRADVAPPPPPAPPTPTPPPPTPPAAAPPAPIQPTPTPANPAPPPAKSDAPAPNP